MIQNKITLMEHMDEHMAQKILAKATQFQIGFTKICERKDGMHYPMTHFNVMDWIAAQKKFMKERDLRPVAVRANERMLSAVEKVGRL